MYAAAGGASLARSRAARANNRKSAGDGHRTNRHQNNNPNALTFNRPVTPLPPPIQHQEPITTSNHSKTHHHHHQHQHQHQHLERVHEEDHERHHSLDKPPSYADLNGRITSFGSNDLISEGQGGKAAWQERERRVSVAEVAVNHRLKATEAHRRWMKRNRIHDSSFGGSSSDDDDIPGGLYGHQSAAANALLYVGLGMVAIGFVIFFVGTGEKGFKTLELRLIGPTLIITGFLCCVIRVLLCVCPSRCLRRRRKHRHHHKHGNSLRHYDEHGFIESETVGTKTNDVVEEIQLNDQNDLVRKNSKKTVSILTSPMAMPSSSSQDQYPIIASTTMFLKDEKDRNVTNRPPSYSHHHQIPTINIPNLIMSNSDDDDSISVVKTLQQQMSPATSPTGTYDLLEYELQQMDDLDYRLDNEFGSPVKNGGKEYGGSGRLKDFLHIESEMNGDTNKEPVVKSSYRDSKITKPRSPMNSNPNIDPYARSYSASSRRLGLINPDPDSHRIENETVANKTLKRLNSTLATSTPKHRDVNALMKNEIVLSPSKLQQHHIREQ